MSPRVQMACLWCGPAAIVVFTLGFWIFAGLIPPPSPNDTAAEVQALYRENTDMMRIGLVLTLLAGAMTAPWVAAIAALMKRVEGRFSPLTYTQLGLGMIGILFFIIPAMAMQTAAFRPDRDPETILLIHDFAWLVLVGVFAPASGQGVALAVCIFKDREEKVFPRWLGYFNVWVALMFVPGALIYFFKVGPFAWDGFFTFWLPLTVFFIWFGVSFPVLRRSVQRLGRTEQLSVDPDRELAGV